MFLNRHFIDAAHLPYFSLSFLVLEHYRLQLFLSPPFPFFFFTSFLNHKQSISVSYYSMVYFPRDTIQLFISSLSSQNEHAQGMNIYKMYP